MKSFFSSKLMESHSGSPFSPSGHGVNLAFSGMMPRRFWLAKMVSRTLVPALVEQVHIADLLDPLRCRMMRRMGGARYVIDEERFVGRDLLQLFHVVDGVVGH